MARAARRQGSRQQRKRRSRRASQAQLEQLHLNAVGIDVGAESHFVAVPGDRDEQPVQRFGAFPPISTPWLSGCGRVRLRPW